MNRDTRRPVRVQVSGEEHVGHYEVGPFQHGGHTITVFYRGQRKTDRIPPEVNHASYLKQGRAIIGGVVPKDEFERATLTEQHDHALRGLDRKYRNLLHDEAAMAFLAWLAKDKARAVIELNQVCV